MHYATIQVKILIVTDYFHEVNELILDIHKSGTHVTHVSVYFSFFELSFCFFYLLEEPYPSILLIWP